MDFDEANLVTWTSLLHADAVLGVFGDGAAVLAMIDEENVCVPICCLSRDKFLYRICVLVLLTLVAAGLPDA